MFRSEYNIWQDELNGEKPARSSWWLVLLALAFTAVAVHFLHH